MCKRQYFKLFGLVGFKDNRIAPDKLRTYILNHSDPKSFIRKYNIVYMQIMKNVIDETRKYG